MLEKEAKEEEGRAATAEGSMGRREWTRILRMDELCLDPIMKWWGRCKN